MDLRHENHGLTPPKPWTYGMEPMDLRYENHGHDPHGQNSL